MKTLLNTLAAVTLATITACAEDKGTFEVYEASVLVTSAPMSILSHAASQTHEALGHRVKDDKGRDYDPSFGQISTWWKTGKPSEPQTPAVMRGKTEFKDADGHRIVIEYIWTKGGQTVVFFTHEGKTPEAVLNAYIASLQKQGVKKSDK